MKRILSTLLVVVVTFTTYAIEGLRISVVQSNAVLSWPSQTNETFIVQWRAGFETNCPWVTLSTNHLAATNTNWTVFTHTNQIPGNTNITTMGVGGSGGPPPMMLSSSTSASTTDAAKPKKEKIKQTELPPMPWDPSSWTSSTTAQRSGGVQPMESGSGEGSTNSTTSCGFYRVVRTGVSLWAPDLAGVASGKRNVRVEVGHTNGELNFLTVLLNGGASDAAGMIAKPFIDPVAEIDTLRLTNGLHSLQVQAFLAKTPLDEAPNENGGLLTLSSTGTTLAVTNAISYPYLEPFFFDDYRSLFIQARSVDPVVNYWIDFYSPSGSYVGQFHGATTNGLIAVQLGFSGTSTLPAFFTAVITTVNAANQQNSLSLPPLWKGRDIFPSVGDWAVVKQKAFDSHENGDLLYAMVDTVAGALQLERANSVLPAFSTIEAYPLRASGSDPSDITNSWGVFFNAITNFSTRNLFYMGHGLPDSLGGYTNNTPWYGITASQIAEALGNTPFLNKKIPFTNGPPHRYRFVFIYGCNGASGSLPAAFGISNNRDEDIGLYQPGEPRPAALLSFNGSPTIAHKIGGGWGVYPHMIEWPEKFWNRWTVQGRTLEEAVNLAKQDVPSFPGSKIKIVGNKLLLYNQANTR